MSRTSPPPHPDHPTSFDPADTRPKPEPAHALGHQHLRGRRLGVDPGPAIDSHLEAVEAAVERPRGVVLTHSHADHSEAATPLAARLGVEVVSRRRRRSRRPVRRARAARPRGRSPRVRRRSRRVHRRRRARRGQRVRQRAPARIPRRAAAPARAGPGASSTPATATRSTIRTRSSTSTSPTASIASASCWPRWSPDRARDEDELLDAAWADAPAAVRPLRRDHAARAPGKAAARKAATADVSRSRPISSAARSGVVFRAAARVEDLAQRVADRADVGVGALGRVAVGLELDGDVDDAAGVADEVRRPQDAALGERRRRARRRRAGCWRRRRSPCSAAPGRCRR